MLNRHAAAYRQKLKLLARVAPFTTEADRSELCERVARRLYADVWVEGGHKVFEREVTDTPKAARGRMYGNLPTIHRLHVAGRWRRVWVEHAPDGHTLYIKVGAQRLCVIF